MQRWRSGVALRPKADVLFNVPAETESEDDPHKVLRKYHEFMKQTEEPREQIGEAAIQLDMHIQHHIDIARGK